MKFYGGGKGSGHASSICSKGALLATFADPFNNTIYRMSSIFMRAATTKIPHLLCENTYLKPQMECVILFTIDDLFTMNVI